MTSPESDKGWIEITFNALRKIRERQGRYAVEDVEAYRITKEIVYKIMDEELEDKKRMEEWLRETTDNLSEVNVAITPLTVTANTCLNMSMQMMRDATELFRTKEFHAPGIDNFDMGRGFATVMAGLLGEYKIFQDSRHISDQGVLIRLQSINELFRDPTGFSYVEKAAESWGRAQPSKGGMIEPYEVREAVIDGVKLGADVYKRMYPIAQKVLSSGS